MSYSDQLAGGITFSPPVSYKEFRDTKFWKRPGDRETDRLVWLDVVEEPGESDDGPIVIKRAVGIRVADDEVRADDLREQVQEIISAFLNIPGAPPRRFEGEIHIYHGSSPVGTVRRIRVYNIYLLSEERAELVWPDGTKVRFL